MRTGIGLSVLAVLPTVLLAACASLPATQQTPYLPEGVFGTYEDNDIGAINFSAWAFSSPTHTHGNPIEAARAIISLEYLPGELLENPRWIGMDRSIKQRLGQSRAALRQIVGIRPDAPPQLVVNTMLAFVMDLETGNLPVAMQVLASPLFTHPPERTFQVLSNLPYLQEANLATSRAEDESFPVGGNVR
jgi:hypothetical protein